jgi:hypothetical protein
MLSEEAVEVIERIQRDVSQDKAVEVLHPYILHRTSYTVCFDHCTRPLSI